MKRYQLVLKGDTGFIRLDEHPEGSWLRFDDHAAEVHRLNNALTAAYLELAAIKALLESQSRALTAALRHVDPQGD